MLLGKLQVIQSGILYWLEAHSDGWRSPEQPGQARAVNALFPIVPGKPDDPLGMSAFENCAKELKKLGVVRVFPEPDPVEPEAPAGVVY